MNPIYSEGFEAYFNGQFMNPYEANSKDALSWGIGYAYAYRYEKEKTEPDIHYRG